MQVFIAYHYPSGRLVGAYHELKHAKTRVSQVSKGIGWYVEEGGAWRKGDYRIMPVTYRVKKAAL